MKCYVFLMGVLPFIGLNMYKLVKSTEAAEMVTSVVNVQISSKSEDVYIHPDTEVANVARNGNQVQINQDSFSNNATFSPQATAKPLWADIVDKLQIIMDIIGFVANVATAITLHQNGSAFSPVIRILFQHQSLVDALICVISLIFVIKPNNWMTGIQYLDSCICYIHHSYFSIGVTVGLSVWNLVYLSMERWLAVCLPFRHKDLTTGRLKWALVGLYVVSIIGTSPNFVLHVKLQDKACLARPLFDTSMKRTQDMMYAYAVFHYLFCYAAPCALLFLFYGLVILTLHRRQKQSKLGSSSVIESAANELTKTALVVTLIFIFSLGFDLWTYLLANFGYIPSYTLGSPIQRAALWLLSVNSGANPFIYVMLIPAYRRSIRSTFCCHQKVIT